jgi:hypothetical protein
MFHGFRVRVFVALFAFAFIASGCGSDDSSSEAKTSTSTSAQDTVDGTESASDELTASFRGVTEDSIKIGVLYADFDALREAVGIDLDHGSYEEAHLAVIDDINTNGGILGRQIDPVIRGINPVNAADVDVACVELTQDTGVFVVMGGLLDDQPLCYTEGNDTAFIGSTQTDERVESSAAPWYTGVGNADEVAATTVSGFIERGIFDAATVAVVGYAADRALVEEVVVPLLTEAGIEGVTTSILGAGLSDVVANENELDVVIEQHNANGVDLVVTVGQASVAYPRGLELSDFRPQIASTSLSSMLAYIRDSDGSRDLSVLKGAVAGNTAEQPQWWDDSEIQRCIGLVEDRTGETILDPNTRDDSEPENIVSVAAACRDLGLLVALGEASGVELTNESLASAGAALGEFHVPGQGLANFDTGGPDGDIPVYYFEWNAEVGDMVPDGSTL